MSKALGRATYLFFFLLFFILTPIFTMYGLGYRYNFDTGQIEKSGAFYVKSFPKGASIFVDDEQMDDDTPTQLTNIKPGHHLLQVKKDKYRTWQKELEIYPGETTFAEDVVLFYQDMAKTKLDSGSEKYLVSHTLDKYAYLDSDNQLHITDVEQAKDFTVFTLPSDMNLLDWSADNQKLLLQNVNEYYVFDINQKNLDRLAINKNNKTIWDNKNADLLWYLYNDKLFQYDISNSFEPDIREIKLGKKVNDFAFYDDYLVVQYIVSDSNYVEQLKKSGLESIKIINKLSLGKLDILLADEQKIIFTVGSKLYIKYTYRDLITIPIITAELHDERLLITNGHEIMLYNHKEDWQELIDRSSQIISDILWHPNGSYFLGEINGQTKITEIDGRDQRNIINILDNPHKKLYLFNSKGDNLFILTPEENYYLNVQ
ncbi:PEGA domain-containing protein [Candidatus Parcubacteria bacterium]|jgi:hypothetical protein|nr:PEGA domain-containing protein [Candidatus Parcubacteria bacterium]